MAQPFGFASTIEVANVLSLLTVIMALFQLKKTMIMNLRVSNSPRPTMCPSPAAGTHMFHVKTVNASGLTTFRT